MISEPSVSNAPPQPLMSGELLRLRATQYADCAFVATAEAEPDAASYVGQWSVARHQRAVDDPDTAHWIIEGGAAPFGFAILEGAQNPARSLLLRRLVITDPGNGYGSESVRLLASYCFDSLGFHRLWLYVAVANERAHELYRRLGFVQEGIARESMRAGHGYASMYILSLLEREWRHSRTGEGILGA